MSDPAPVELLEPAVERAPQAPAPSRARAALFKRLADIVCLPASRVNTFERSMTADVLIEMLQEASVAERERVARRLSRLTEIPDPLIRMLLRDEISVARPLIEDCATIPDPHLLDCVRMGTTEHRRLIALRRGVGEVVCEALVQLAEPAVVEALLRNNTARLSGAAVDALVAASRDLPRIVPLLLRREELRPHHAYVMFWWSDAEARKCILQRFAVSREVLQEAAGDVFPMAAAEGWSDPLSRKALQFIERRQRNRAAIQKSPFASLDEAVASAAGGLTRRTAEEIAHLAGVKPMVGAKIFTDPGGEPIAILCKATGLPRICVRQLWTGLKRPETDAAGVVHPSLERVLIAYDMMAVDRAQTVLRYWNWSLSSALNPELIETIRRGDEAKLDEFSQPQRTAMLALGADLAR